MINIKDISIESDLFHVLLDLSDVFHIPITEGKEGAHQLCEDYAAISQKEYNHLMINLQNDLKVELTKTYFPCVLKQYKSFEQQKKHIPVLDLIKKFDIEFLKQCIEKANESNRNEVFIHIKDNNSIAIASASEGTVLANVISLTTLGKIAIHSECGGVEFTEFIELQALYDLVR